MPNDSKRIIPSYTVYDLFTEVLGLKGCDLNVYAIVFSYAINGKTLYASLNKIAKRAGASPKSVQRALSRLVKDKYIVRSDKIISKTHTYEYSITIEVTEGLLSGKITELETYRKVFSRNTTQEADNKEHIKAEEDQDKMTGSKRPGQPGQNVRVNQDKMTGSPGQNDLVNQDKMTDNKNINSKNDNKAIYIWDTNDIHTPFNFKILNKTWQTLIAEPKWEARSPASLKISIRTLQHYEPHVANFMMENALERGLDKIYPPNDNMLQEANSAASKKAFYKQETIARQPNVEEVLKVLSKELPDDLKEHMPTIECFCVSKCDSKVRHIIICTRPFMAWLESNIDRRSTWLDPWQHGGELVYAIVKDYSQERISEIRKKVFSF